MTLATSLPVGVLGCFIGGAGNGFYYVSVVQAIQDRVDDEFQGRVMGLLESITAGTFGFGFLVAAAVTELTSVRVTFAVTTGGVILATLWMVVLLRRFDGGTPEASVSHAEEQLERPELEIEGHPIGILGDGPDAEAV
jgi:MFS family permease